MDEFATYEVYKVNMLSSAPITVVRTPPYPSSIASCMPTIVLPLLLGKVLANSTFIYLSLVTEATFVGGAGASGAVARVKVPIPLYS